MDLNNNNNGIAGENKELNITEQPADSGKSQTITGADITGNPSAIENNKRKGGVALFISGQITSLFGSSLVAYAMVWYITLLTGSGIYMTISALCSFLPQVVISLFAGVWADRNNKKFLIMFADIFTAVFTLALAVFFLLGFKELWLMFLVMAMRSVGAGIQSPAVSASLPLLVPQDKLVKVNGITGSLMSLTMIISPALSGALIAFAKIEYIFFIDVITAALAVFQMSFLRIPSVKAEEKKNVLNDLSQGFKYVKNNTVVFLILVYYLIFIFFVTPPSFLSPLLITRTYGGEVWRLTVNEVAFSSGAVLGGFLIAKWGGFKSRTKTLSFSFMLFGIFITLSGVSPNFYFYLAAILGAGIVMPLFNTASTVLLQENVPPDKLGRVFSIVQIITAAGLPVGSLVFGPLAEIMKIEYLLILSGIIICAMAASMGLNKYLKKY